MLIMVDRYAFISPLRKSRFLTVVDLSNGEAEVVDIPDMPVGQPEPVLSDNGRAIAFEYRPVDGAVQIGHLVESDAKTWRLSGLFTGQGQSLFKPGVSSDGRTVVCYAERATGGFEFAWILPERVRRCSRASDHSPRDGDAHTVLSINSKRGLSCPGSGRQSTKEGLGYF